MQIRLVTDSLIVLLCSYRLWIRKDEASDVVRDKETAGQRKTDLLRMVSGTLNLSETANMAKLRQYQVLIQIILPSPDSLKH